MAHPIFQDPPSRDMSAAAERQIDIDDKIEAFLAQGGKIQGFDALRHPVEADQWAKPSISARRPEPAATPKVEAAPKPAAQPRAVVPPATTPVKNPKAHPTQLDDEQLAVKIIVSAALGGSPRVIARDLHIPLKRCLAIAEQCHVRFHVGGGHVAQ